MRAEPAPDLAALADERRYTMERMFLRSPYPTLAPMSYSVPFSCDASQHAP